MFAWVVAAVVFVREGTLSRFRDRFVTVVYGHGLWEAITAPPFSCIDASGRLDKRRLANAFRASFLTGTHNGDSEAYVNVVRCLRRYIVGHNFAAWQLICATSEVGSCAARRQLERPPLSLALTASPAPDGRGGGGVRRSSNGSWRWWGMRTSR